MAVGFAPPSKTHHNGIISTRNYHGEGKDIVIAPEPVPVVDVQLIVGVEPTNISNVGAKPVSVLPSTFNLTVVLLRQAQDHHCILFA